MNCTWWSEGNSETPLNRTTDGPEAWRRAMIIGKHVYVDDVMVQLSESGGEPW